MAKFLVIKGRRNPLFILDVKAAGRVRRNPHLGYDREEVSNLLGVPPATVDELAREGVLKVTEDEGDQVFLGRDLADFIGQLEPVEVEIVESAPARENPKNGKKKGEVTEPEAEQEPVTYVIPCPHCRQPATVGQGVVAYECPHCGEVVELAFDEEAEQDDEPERTVVATNPRRGVFKLFRRR